ncbi:MAG TPA: tetratricopeptide repeat protein [Anaeromyxobacteraceae bacterium]|nr:tetratricopeptide repeat protein [Anaeromyxobacteraceae bacterium]
MTAGRRLLLAALLATAAGCGGVGRKLEEGNDLRHAGKPREALAAYREVLAVLGEAPLSRADADLRLRALKYAADVSYLELGDYVGAISYYRRIISLYPGGEEAWRSRAAIGDIYVDRFNDRVAAIAQYADVAASPSRQAPRYQLLVARQYLELRNYEQARTEARILREKWPQSPEADEAQLLTAQAWALEQRTGEAMGAFQAAIDRKPRQEVAALALEGQAHLYAQLGRFDKAIELYARALPAHPNPDAIRTNIEKVRERREAARTVTPGDREAVFDRKRREHTKEVP